jgi:hypothetical protein
VVRPISSQRASRVRLWSLIRTASSTAPPPVSAQGCADNRSRERSRIETYSVSVPALSIPCRRLSGCGSRARTRTAVDPAGPPHFRWNGAGPSGSTPAVSIDTSGSAPAARPGEAAAMWRTWSTRSSPGCLTTGSTPVSGGRSPGHPAEHLSPAASASHVTRGALRVVDRSATVITRPSAARRRSLERPTGQWPTVDESLRGVSRTRCTRRRWEGPLR